MAKTIKENKVPVDNIYKLSTHHTWALDFYNQKPVKIVSIDAIKNKNPITEEIFRPFHTKESTQ